MLDTIGRRVLYWVAPHAAVLVVALVPAPPGRVRAEEAPTTRITRGGTKADRPGTSITISRETTYIVHPLRDDGYLDYVAALNEHCRRGVTVENNAGVLLVRAFGPGPIDEKVRRHYFKLLGMRPLPDEGLYFVSFFEYVRNRVERPPPAAVDPHNDAERDFSYLDELHHALEQPWAKDECPVVAEWLRANQKPLALVVEATRRPQYYSPIVAKGGLAAAFPDFLSEHRDAKDALIARAMRHLRNGDPDACREDLLACHRLARLLGQDPTLISAATAMAIDGVASNAEIELAHRGRLSAEQARKFQRDLHGLPPWPDLAEAVQWGERFFYLDVIGALAREGPELLDEMLNPSLDPEALLALLAEHAGPESGERRRRGLRRRLTEFVLAALARREIRSVLKKPIYRALRVWTDWNEALRHANDRFDQLAEAYRQPAGPQRSEGLQKVLQQTETFRDCVTDPRSVLADLLRGKPISAVLAHYQGGKLLAFLVPPCVATGNMQDKAITRFRLTCTAFALAGYRADHGRYPERLSQLRPHYLVKPVKDLFTGAEFCYRRTEHGYFLYSVGPNAQDDGGRNRRCDSQAEKDPDYQGDDIAIRTRPASR